MRQKIFLAIVFTVASLGALDGFGQGAQADMIKRRAKETVNQNNVRQGVPSPAQTAPQPAAPTVNSNTIPAAQALTNLKSDLANFKTGSIATAAQKQQFTIHLAQAVRGKKPNLGVVTKFVDSLTAALPGAALTPEQQTRLAQNLDAVLNAKSLSTTKFDAVIADTQAILEVGSVKRATAVSIANALKAIGTEIRR